MNRLVLISVPVFISSVAFAGPDWTEVPPDAGAITGQNIPFSPVSSITGTLAGMDADGGADVVDLFRFRTTTAGVIIGAGVTSFRGGQNNFDTVLFLFDQNGFGIAANDNFVAGALGSRIVIPTAGDFLLGITVRGVQPFSTGGNIFDILNNPVGQIGPNNDGGQLPLVRWDGVPAVAEPGDYLITFDIPAPSAAGLLILGVLSGGRRRR